MFACACVYREACGARSAGRRWSGDATMIASEIPRLCKQLPVVSVCLSPTQHDTRKIASSFPVNGVREAFPVGGKEGGEKGEREGVGMVGGWGVKDLAAGLPEELACLLCHADAVPGEGASVSG